MDTKKDFFVENDKLLDKIHVQNDLYISQRLRTSCKICAETLPDVVDFHSHKIDYVFCAQFSHLNGKFEDTPELIASLYISDGGSDYSSNYIDSNFQKRTSDIYLPKIEFLMNSLPDKDLELLDVGCGSGYFVYAALMKGIKATGVDVSRKMVDFGNNQICNDIRSQPLCCIPEDKFYDAIIKSHSDVISAIGVIEHLREPQKFFDAFRKCRAKYLFYSVPMFSLSSILENIFKDIFPRQLSGGHTHLFTEQSIGKMNDIIGVRPVAEWRFGTDIIDLYRCLNVSLQKNRSSQKMIDQLYMGLASSIDDIQHILDKKHFCSEVHCVVSKA